MLKATSFKWDSTGEDSTTTAEVLIRGAIKALKLDNLEALDSLRPQASSNNEAVPAEWMRMREQIKIQEPYSSSSTRWD